jgi:hypothetical protein
MPAVVNRVQAACVDNAILLDCLVSEVVLEERERGSTDADIQIGNNCTNDEQHLRMPAASGEYADEGNNRIAANAIPTVIELLRFDLGTSAVDGYEGVDGNSLDEAVEDEALQSDAGSTLTGED